MSIIFYHIFLWLYKRGIHLVAPWNRKAQRWLEGRKDIFGKIRAEMEEGTGGKTIWMHCASLGEFEQGRPLDRKSVV